MGYLSKLHALMIIINEVNEEALCELFVKRSESDRDTHRETAYRLCCSCLPSLMTLNLSFRLCGLELCLYLFAVNVFAHSTELLKALHIQFIRISSFDFLSLSFSLSRSLLPSTSPSNFLALSIEGISFLSFAFLSSLCFRLPINV